MDVHTTDHIEKILEDDGENDYSKNGSSGAQETSSSNLVDPSPNFDILQVFQNSQVIGFLRGLMTHQAPQNVQSPQSSHAVTYQGVISPHDENPPNPDQNDSTVSQADDTSAEMENLENLAQDMKELRKGTPPPPPHFQEKIQITQDLIWGIYRTEKFERKISLLKTLKVSK